MKTATSINRFIRIFLLSLFVISIPVEEAEANRLWDFVYKRYLKRSKMKKWAPKLLGEEPALENFAIRDKYEVIGYEPSWLLEENGTYEEKETYYFNLMTTLVSGEYDINPETGFPRSEENLYKPIRYTKRVKEYQQQLSIYQRAFNDNTQIKLLTRLTYSGDYGRPAYQSVYEQSVLTDPEVFENLVDQLDQYYQELYSKVKIKPGRAGILVDFDFSAPNADKEFLLEFLQNLHNRFEDNLIYLKIPALTKENNAFPTEFIQDLLELEDEIVDMFIMEAHGFEKYSKEIIPSVYFNPDSKYSVESSIAHYTNFEFDEYDEDRIAEMAERFKQQLVLEFPYYGAIWERKDRISPYKLRKKNAYLSYDEFWGGHVGKKGSFAYGPDSMYVYSEENHVFAFGEDSISMFRKTHYAVDTLQLKGFAINSIGYFYKKPTTLQAKLPKIWRGYANTDSQFTKKKEYLGWVIAYFIIAFIPIGFMYSVGYYWEVRNALAKHTKYYTRFKWFFALFLFIFLTVANIIPRGPVGLVIGIILLLFLFIYILIKKVLIRSKKYVNALK